MNRVIYKSYQNLTNVLFRMSSSAEESKNLAILLNSHLDSTLPSPGAADDALSVAISLEIARVLIEAAGKGEWEVGWGVVIRQCVSLFLKHDLTRYPSQSSTMLKSASKMPLISSLHSTHGHRLSAPSSISKRLVQRVLNCFSKLPARKWYACIRVFHTHMEPY